MSSHILTVRGQRVDYTLWLITGVDNDQWDFGSLDDVYYQGSRIGTTLTGRRRPAGRAARGRRR